MSQRFGILINYPKAGIKDMLLKEPGGKHLVYSSLVGAEARAKDQMLLFGDQTMVCGIVPLDEKGNPGPPIKKYQLVDSVVKEVG